jgi:hypothetical protein
LNKIKTIILKKSKDGRPPKDAKLIIIGIFYKFFIRAYPEIPTSVKLCIVKTNLDIKKNQ